MTETEATLIAVFAGLVPARHLTPDDDLFSMGADSLAALRAVIELERTFQLHIPQEILLHHRSIGDLARWIDSVRGNAGK